MPGPDEHRRPATRIHRTISESGSAYLHTDQYYNPRNTQAHVDGTGPETVKDLDGRVPDYFIACVGTAGSSTGVARVLREQDPSVTVVGLVAAKSDFIPGIRDIDEVHQVGLFDPTTYDTIEAVSAEEAIDGLVALNRRCGVLAGPTGGAGLGRLGDLRVLGCQDSLALDSTLQRRHGLVTFRHRRISAADLGFILAEHGLMVRADAHCQGPAGERDDSVRVSLHAYNTVAEVDRLLDVLACLDTSPPGRRRELRIDRDDGHGRTRHHQPSER